LHRSAFAGETNNGASRLNLNCSFIAAYCDLGRFEPVGPLQCSGIALEARVVGERYASRNWKAGAVLGV
jgi:hypothetical protein